MINRSSSAKPQRLLWMAKRPLFIVLLVAAVFAALGVAEVTESDVSGDTIGHSASLGIPGFDLPEFPGDGLAELPEEDPQWLPELGLPEVPDFELPNVPEGGSPDDILAYAQGLVDDILAQMNADVGAAQADVGTAQFGPFDPLLRAIVCPILHAARAQVIAITNALIAQFPFLAPQVLGIQAAALAVIDAQLAAFGCLVLSG